MIFMIFLPKTLFFQQRYLARLFACSFAAAGIIRGKGMLEAAQLPCRQALNNRK